MHLSYQKMNERNYRIYQEKIQIKKEIRIKEESAGDQSKFIFTFQSPLSSQVLNVEAVYTKNIIPHPEQIKQNEKQLVKYSGLLYLFSPYKTVTQRTSIKLSSSNILSHTQIKPFSASANKIKYGPYENIEALSNETFFVHYENETPFMTVTHLERIIEVSHWGNIAVKENILLEHSGAKLKGSFSRYEFQKDTRSGQASVKSYKTILPASAADVYYRDSNGNISTSNMNVMRDAVELELRPRFPLFGGWKTQYILGYNLPSFEYLYNSNENYLLKMRVIDHIYDDMIVDEALIKVILPEGSSQIELITPYAVHRNPNELYFTYLDTVGRPVVSFSKTNLIENHITDFDIKYKFSKISLLQEPILLITFVFIIFILTIIFLRLDFSISTHSHKE